MSLPLLFFSSFLVVFCCYRHHSFALSWLYKNGMKNEPRNVYTNIVILCTRAILKSSYRKNNNRMVWEYEHTNQKKRGAVEEKKICLPLFLCTGNNGTNVQNTKICPRVLLFFPSIYTSSVRNISRKTSVHITLWRLSFWWLASL